MITLGIETSCDETAAAIVRDGHELLSNVVRSQIDLIIPVIEEALQKAHLAWGDIDAIGIANGPGLVGSLLIGTLTARTLAITKNKPLYAIDHVKAHVYANFLL